MNFNLRRDKVELSSKDKAKQDLLKSLNLKDLDLNYKDVCFSGKIKGLTRMEAMEKIKKVYPNVRFDKSINRYTNYLLIGFDVGETKLIAARRKNIPIIDVNQII